MTFGSTSWLKRRPSLNYEHRQVAHLAGNKLVEISYRHPAEKSSASGPPGVRARIEQRLRVVDLQPPELKLGVIDVEADAAD